jgi:cytoskeletal protein CcmA (bactofilin family)
MATLEKTRAIIEAEETFDGRVIPSEQADLGRPVRLREGSTIQGSVYGGTVEADPGVTVEGSVMASDAVDLTSTDVGGEVGSSGKITAEHSRIDGGVTGSRVNLTDTTVFGNVVATEAILEDCIVLGVVATEWGVRLEDTLCYTFKSQGASHIDGTSIILPQAIVDGELTLETPVAVTGLGRLEIENAPTTPTLTMADRYEQDVHTYLTMAPRILNLKKVTDRLDELETALKETVTALYASDQGEVSVDRVLRLLEDSDSHSV